VLNIFTRLFGSRNQRLLRSYAERVRQSNGFAEALAAETDEGLRARTDKLRTRLVAGETLDDILPEAFATAPARPRAARSACAPSTCS
jgi:preprotein translocase subunit SecA